MKKIWQWLCAVPKAIRLIWKHGLAGAHIEAEKKRRELESELIGQKFEYHSLSNRKKEIDESLRETHETFLLGIKEIYDTTNDRGRRKMIEALPEFEKFFKGE